MKICYKIIALVLLTQGVTFAGVNGVEFRLTLSGKPLLGIGFRSQFDGNTALRAGVYAGIAGAPVGFYAAIAQDLMPSKPWTPFFQAGFDVLLYKKQTIRNRISPGATLGFSFCPQQGIRHSAEVWLTAVGAGIRPLGLSYVLFNSIY